MTRKGKLTAAGLCLLCAAPGAATTAETGYESGLSAYRHGDYDSALALLKASAEKGSARAGYLLGTLYRRGIGVEADEYESFYWCRRAAEQGLLEAQFQLGLMYLEGEGVTENRERAIEWLWAAADSGYPQATEVLQYVLTHQPEYGC